MRSDKLVLNWIEKVKPGFSLSEMCMFPGSTGTKFWFHSFHPQIQVFSRPEWTKGGTPKKWILTIFKYKNGYHKQLELKKYMKKYGAICLVPLFTFWVMVLKLPHYLQTCADLCKWPKFTRYWRIKYQKKCWLTRNLTKFIKFKG